MFINPLTYFHTTDQKFNLIYNGANGAFDIVDPKTCDVLSLSDSKELEQSLKNLEDLTVSLLIDRGYLFKNSDDFFKLKEQVEKNVNNLQDDTFHIAIIMSYNCNMNCVYCYEKMEQAPSQQMDIRNIDYVLNVVKYLQDKDKNIIVQLYGGEPLLLENMQIISELCSRIRGVNINELFIITNGVNLKNYIEIFKKFSDINFTLQVTIDGTKQIHDSRRIYPDGSYDGIIEGMLLSLEYPNISITMRTNVDSSNVNNIAKLYETLEPDFAFFEKFTSYLAITKNPIKAEQLMETDIIKLIETLPKIQGFVRGGGLHLLSYPYSLLDSNQRSGPKVQYCEATQGNYWSLSPDGLIYPCSEVVGFKEAAIGKYITDITIDENKYGEWLDNNVISNKICNQCSIRLLCGSGCKKDKDQIGVDSFCKKMFSDVNDYFNYFKERMNYE